MDAADALFFDHRATSSVPAALLDLEAMLSEWRRGFQSRISSRYPDHPPEERLLSRAFRGASPLAVLIDPLPEASLLSEAISGFLGAAAGTLPVLESLGRWLAEAGPARSRQAREARWFTASWKGDRAELERIAAESGIRMEVLAWAGDRVAQPFFGRLGVLLKSHPGFGKGAPPRSDCPCCGRGPQIGRYAREDGRRLLWCSLCDLEWSFPKAVCPFCANMDPHRLGQWNPRWMRGHRIDSCTVCGGYLRAVDERALPEGAPVDLAVAEVETLYLRSVAEKAGCQSRRT